MPCPISAIGGTLVAPVERGGKDGGGGEALQSLGSGGVGGAFCHVTTYYKSLVCKSGVDVARGSNMSANKLKYFFSFSLPNLMVSS